MTTAHVVHHLPGRLRLRIPEKRMNQIYFDNLKAQALEFGGVEHVSVDPLTGSLLIRHVLADEELTTLLQTDLELDLEPAPVPVGRDALASLGASINTVDHRLKRATGGATDLRVLLFMLLVGMAIRQILRGQVMIPAAALLWNAFELVLHRPSDTGT